MSESKGKVFIDPKQLTSYGDSANDGAVQLSFTLPIPYGALAKEAAKVFVRNLGFDTLDIVSMEDMQEGYTFFVVYAHTQKTIDVSKIKVMDVSFRVMSREETDDFIQKKIGRPLVVVGATIESDAHTVGLDAILNMKGYHGDYGLERYKMFTVHNMGSQVLCEEVVRKVKETKADALLISQIVTQKNLHIQNLTKLMDLLEIEGVRKGLLTIVGGPRISYELAVELGYDVGFGSGTVPSQVASYIATTLSERAELT
ncbi:MAG: hypothetical protein GX462_05705 [Thermotogaceae bacterium]|nr:hypothetical protein [Thermotogaceae bacterium]